MKFKDIKREEGAVRNAQWAMLSVVEKLRALDSRLGKGVGAKRQRRKLAGAHK